MIILMITLHNIWLLIIYKKLFEESKHFLFIFFTKCDNTIHTRFAIAFFWLLEN